MSTVIGVDGCKSGWVTIAGDIDADSVSWCRYTNAWELMRIRPLPMVIAIDIPIGLPLQGPRLCDREARKLIGRGRAGSVFPAPVRPVLDAKGYEDACGIRLREDGRKMSRQAWGIVHKIREVDDVLRENLKLQSIMREVHPEVSFFFLAGQHPMRHSKKTTAGRQERRQLLEPIFGNRLQEALSERRWLDCAEDDILDAFAALWTAKRIASGTARTLPTVPPRDSFGLRMEIVV